MKSSLWNKFAVGFIIAFPVVIIISLYQWLNLLNVLGIWGAVANTQGLLRGVEATDAAVKDSQLAMLRAKPEVEAQQGESLQADFSAVRLGVQQLVPAARSAEQQRDLLKIQTRLRDEISSLKALTDEIESTQAPAGAGAKKPTAVDKARLLDTQTNLLRDGQKLLDDVATALTRLRKEQKGYLESGMAATGPAERKAYFATSFVDVLALWLVAVAALLLRRSASEHKYAALERGMHTLLLETLPVGVCLADDLGLIFYCNPAHELLLGYPPGDLLGRNVAILMGRSADENEKVLDEIKKQLTLQGSWAGELISRKKNGSTLSTLLRAIPVEMGGKPYKLFVQESAPERARA